MEEYEFYWRVEPSVEFSCDIDYDPFLYMKENNKKYGWTISLIEFEATIPTLWETTKAFMKENPEMIPKNNLMNFVSNDNGKNYNLCHFWSNFEIADLKFLRSPEYTAFFEYLDRSGGFFYERYVLSVKICKKSVLIIDIIIFLGGVMRLYIQLL
jgi:alpha 1,2-mannosyltransferase